MAEGSVIRSDIVQLVFDLPDNPFAELVAAMDGLKGNAGDMAKTVEKQMRGATDSVNSGLQDTADNAQKSTARISEMARALTQTAGEKIKSLPQVLTSSAAAAKNFVAQLKSDTADKLKSRLESIRNISLKGIADGLDRGLGAAATKAISLAKNLKQAAANKLQRVADSARELKNRFTEGQTGAKGLLTALKNIAKTTFSKVHAGLSKIGSIASSAGKTVASALGKGLKVAGKGLAVGAAAAVAGIASLTKSALENYGNYEQLVGGVETLFGAGGLSIEDYAASVGKSVNEISGEYNSLMSAQQIVFDNAAKAYQSAGLSANDYMETVTSFSASLIQSLGGDTAAAAVAADQAIIDMSDNANKMGTDMASIQNAYQGFAKQNFTMLDNLKLGYGGTQEEMQRLLADAQKLTGQKYDISSFADITAAIHAVQENMGIAGTTAKEASETIQGSVSSMKASWSNLVTGIADDNQDLDVLIDNFITSVGTAAKNILPRIQIIFSGIGKLIQQMVPIIVSLIPSLVKDVVPGLLLAASDLVTGLVDGVLQSLPMLLDTVTDVLFDLASRISSMLPKILQTLLDSLQEILGGIGDMLPQLLPMLVEAIISIAEILSSPDTLSAFVDSAIAIVSGLADGILAALPLLINCIPNIITGLATGIIQNAASLISAATDLIITLANGIVDAIPQLVAVIPTLLNALLGALMANLPLLLSAGTQALLALVQGVTQSLPALIQGAVTIVQTLVQWIANNISTIVQLGVQVLGALISGLVQAIPQLIAAVPQIVSALIDTIMQTNWLQVGWDIIKGIGGGLISGIGSLFGGGEDGGETVAAGFASGISAGTGQVTAATSALTNSVQIDTTSFAAQGTELTTNLAAGITAGTENVTTATTALTNSVQLDTSGAAAQGTALTTSLASGISAGAGQVTAATSALTTDITSTVQTESDACVNIAQTGCAQITNTISQTATGIKNTMQACDLYGTGTNIMNGLNNGLLAGKGGVLATARAIANEVAATINHALDIHSPSRVLEETGLFADKGLENGLQKGLPGIKDTAVSVAETLDTTMRYAPEDTSVSASRSIENNYFNPVFNLTIQGANMSERDLEHKTKRWIQESIQEVFNSASRRRPKLQEV